MLGQRVCALVAGGGYAEYAVAPAGQCLPVPEVLSMEEAAALPETLTASGFALIVHPAIAFLLSHHVFGLSSTAVHAAVALAAMPPGVNIYIFASLYDRAVNLAASTLLLATALSVVSVTVWLYMVDTLLPL